MPYTVTTTASPEELILVPIVFGESRGFLFESCCELTGKLIRVVRSADLENKAWADAEALP